MRVFIKLRPEHYWSILLAQIFLLFIAALMEEHPVLYALFALSLVWIFGSVITTIWRSYSMRTLALISGAIVVLSAVVIFVPRFGKGITDVGIVTCALSYALFTLIAVVAILSHIYRTKRVTQDTIVGSICAYLMLGMFFAFIYTAMDTIDPEHFNFGIAAVPTINDFREYLYFSYTTLTTLGYGDMIPQMPMARLLASIEAMVGPIYLAITVARLVGMHISQSTNDR